MLEFNKHLDIPFSEIDVAWLRKYEVFLREKGLAENTIGIRFRTLRAIYNIGIDENAVSHDHYPFKKIKVSKLHQDTAKHALTSKSNFKRIWLRIELGIITIPSILICGVVWLMLTT